ncbi:MAG: PAN domain-containing protein [Hyphomicrobiaceae bacterium]
MRLKLSIFLVCLLTMGTSASAQRQSDGFRITCINANSYCTVERLRVNVGNMRWYAGVYVEGDGDIGRFTANSEAQCEAMCENNPRCVMAEFYFGNQSRRPACNLFSYMKRLKYNESGDATVGVWQ